MTRADTRERALILGDRRGHTVLLPAGRGFTGRGGAARTLIAKTCLGCGALRGASEFPVTGSSPTPDPKCRDCHAARLRGRNRALRTHAVAEQSTSVESASQNRQEWTGAQIKTALREDLTAAQAARLLGRTQWAVKATRTRARFGPRQAAS